MSNAATVSSSSFPPQGLSKQTVRPLTRSSWLCFLSASSTDPPKIPPMVPTMAVATGPIPAAPIDWSTATTLPLLTSPPYRLIIHAPMLPAVIPPPVNPRPASSHGAPTIAAAVPAKTAAGFQLKLNKTIYEGRWKSSLPDLVLFRIKLKYYLLLIVARLKTLHAQYDFWAIYILCILAVDGCLHSTWKKNGILQCNEMTILTDLFVPLHALLFWPRNEVVDARFILNNELWLYIYIARPSSRCHDLVGS